MGFWTHFQGLSGVMLQNLKSKSRFTGRAHAMQMANPNGVWQFPVPPMAYICCASNLELLGSYNRSVFFPERHKFFALLFQDVK